MKTIVLADEDLFVLIFLGRLIRHLPSFSDSNFVIHAHKTTADAIIDINKEGVALVITGLNFFETNRSGADIILAAKESDPPPIVILYHNPYTEKLTQQGKTAAILADHIIIKAERGNVDDLRKAANAALANALAAATAAND